MPKDIQEYVHRIGRTGRVGNRGKATSFYDSSINGEIAGALARVLQDAKQAIPEFLGEADAVADIGTDFGGEDIRKGVAPAQKQEADEEW